MTARYITVYADKDAEGVTWEGLSRALEGNPFDAKAPLRVATGNGDVPFLPVRGITVTPGAGEVVFEL